MNNIVFDFRHNYVRGEQLQAQEAVYQYDTGRVLEAYVPETANSFFVQVGFSNDAELSIITPDSVTADTEEGGYKILATIPDSILASKYGTLCIYIVAADGEDQIVTTYEGAVPVRYKAPAEDYVVPDEQAISIIERAETAAAAAEAAAEQAMSGTPTGYASIVASIADAYSATDTYAVGDYVLYESQLYECTTAITTAEAWTAGHWTAVAMANEVSQLNAELTEKLTLKQPTNLCHSDSDWTNGAYVDNGSGAITSSSGLSYSAKMPVNEGDVIRLYDLYGGTFAQRQIRSVAAYNASNTFVSTSNALGWKVNSYTVPEGVAYIILSAPTASNYMVVANTTVTAYEAWFEPYYVASYAFVEDALGSGELSTKDLKNGYACALPKTKFRQTVGIPCTWYKSSMITPPSATVYVNAGYSRTTNDVNTFSWDTETADSTANGFLWYAYDTLMNLLYQFDNNTGYGAATVTKALNLSDCSLLAIGDSTIDQDHMTGKLLSYFSENNHTITLLGTLGSQSEPLNRNEGRAGWTTADYMANTTKNGYTNPFYNPSTEAFDFSYYMTEQSYSGVDFVVIQLGINDLYPDVPRYITEPNYSAIWGNIQTMIDSILAYNSGIKIIINLPTTPNADPTAHYIAEFLYQNYVIKYNNYALDRILNLSESKVRASYCHLILDPTNDINDNVHPKVAGYNKMALEVVNQINCWQNGV